MPHRLLARALAVVFVGTLAASFAHAQNADLELRGGATPPSGTVVRCTAEGVVVVSSVTGEMTIGWDRVRAVRGEHAEEADAYKDVADQAWRAVSRLARGDVPAAEPIFEELFVEYAGQRGPTSAAISGGLLRCRLARGAHTLAVGAWLAWLHASAGEQPAGLNIDHRLGALPLTDAATGLAPELPPIWLGLPAVRVFGQAPLHAERYGEREAALAQLYQHAALTESGRSQPLPRLTSTDPGVRLVWEVVAAQSRSEPERLAGRRAIEKRLRSEPAAWIDAWLRTALGRSLLHESDPDQQHRGVIELLRVRVVHQRDAPYLAGLALADAAVTMRALGDERVASLLRRELLDTFPSHPATTWEPISLWRPLDTSHAAPSQLRRDPVESDRSPASFMPPAIASGPHDTPDPSRSPHG